TPVLVVHVIRMLPDIDREQRRDALGDRRHGVGGRGDLELAVAVHEPGPSAAEAVDGGLRELLLEFLETAQVRVDALREGARGLRSARGSQAVPEEGVVPGLCRVVEDLFL